MTDELHLLTNHLESYKAFNSELPKILDRTIDCTGQEVPYHLRLAMALSELVTIASHTRKSIELYDKTLVPCNAISITLARSGLSKDSSLSAIRKAMKNAYKILETRRNNFARQIAEDRALQAGETADEWLSYYSPPRDLQGGLGTVEGLLKHFESLQVLPIGAASISTSELGTDLQTNGALIDIIKIISQGYDLGNISAKIVKSDENQTSSISALPINALLFGSEDAILFDDTLKQKFKTMFSTQLARRTIFTYSPDKGNKLNIKADKDYIDNLLKYRELEAENMYNAQLALQDDITDVIETTSSEPLTVSEGAYKLFYVYKEYNSLVSDEMTNQRPISKLARKHKQWAALKLSGTYAILDKAEAISEKHYTQAITTIELISDDLVAFERELSKDPHELFAAYCKANADNGKLTVDLHTLQKLGYVPKAQGAKTKLEDLLVMVSSYDSEGIYTIVDTSIEYQKIVTQDLVPVSFIVVD